MTLHRRGLLAASLAIALALASFTPAFAQDKKELVIGATAGPYSDQARGGLDANVFQHIVYLTKFSTENKLAISELLKVPTAPIALHSHKHKDLDVKEGALVALPSDPTNAARALVVLQELGWVKLRDGTDPIKAAEKDVAVNIRRRSSLSEIAQRLGGRQHAC